MSVETTSEVVDETPDTELETQIGSENSSADESPDEGEFSAEQLEVSLGLPPGSLKDAADVDSAMAIVRTHVDKTLAAGFGMASDLIPGGATSKPADEKPAGKNADEKPAGSGNAELDALRAELVEVKSMLKHREEADVQNRFRELEQRVAAEVDSWRSTKYGVTNSRSFRQLQATKELRDLLATHVAGLTASGQAIPNIAAVLKQVRAFHDETYTPATKKTAVAPLGTPQGGKNSKADTTPRNIHDAMAKNPVW